MIFKTDEASDVTLNESLVKYADLIVKGIPIYEEIKIGLIIPATTYSIECTFSTLRRVKTWNRTTMGDMRLSGLWMLTAQ